MCDKKGCGNMAVAVVMGGCARVNLCRKHLLALDRLWLDSPLRQSHSEALHVLEIELAALSGGHGGRAEAATAAAREREAAEVLTRWTLNWLDTPDAPASDEGERRP